VGKQGNSLTIAVTVIILLGIVNLTGIGVSSAQAIEPSTGETTGLPIYEKFQSPIQVAAAQSERNASAAETTQHQSRETTLDAQVTRSNISFINPGRVTGRLALANGSGIGGQVITVSVGHRYYEVQTIPDGRFQLPYRPVAVNASATTVSVTYHPDTEVDYSRASDNISTDIDPINASVEIFERPSAIRYNDQFSVRGRVIVKDGNQVVPEFPFVVQANGVEVTRATTGADGKFDTIAAFPASVNEGNQSLQLRTAQPRAVRLQSNQTIRVGIASTQIRAWVANRSVDSIKIAGQLRTSRGESIPDQTVTLSAGTQEVQTQTTATGTFTASLELSRGSLQRGKETVTVAFTGGGETNLAPASAYISVPPASIESAYGVISAFEQQPGPGKMLIIFAAIISSGAMVAVGSYHGWVNTDLQRIGGDDTETDVVTNKSSTAVSNGKTRDAGDQSIEFTQSRKQLNRGEIEQAVLHSYARVWNELQAWVEADPQTHWELHEAVKSTSLDVDESLHVLTKVYEQTAYGSDTPHFLAGRAAIEASEAVHSALLDETETD
jgi:hypothetical protein